METCPGRSVVFVSVNVSGCIICANPPHPRPQHSSSSWPFVVSHGCWLLASAFDGAESWVSHQTAFCLCIERIEKPKHLWKQNIKIVFMWCFIYGRWLHLSFASHIQSYPAPHKDIRQHCTVLLLLFISFNILFIFHRFLFCFAVTVTCFSLEDKLWQSRSACEWHPPTVEASLMPLSNAKLANSGLCSRSFVAF